MGSTIFAIYIITNYNKSFDIERFYVTVSIKPHYALLVIAHHLQATCKVLEH